MYFLICNGGAKPSGCYGSYTILRGRSLTNANIERIAHETFELPDATTNNEAEYHSLLRGLTGLKEIISPDEHRRRSTIKVLMDSELVVKQISGECRALAENLVGLNLRALRLLAGFERPQRISLMWIDRSIVEEYLGH